MSLKPTDIFIGLADFFSILLPGFCVVFLFGYNYGIPVDMIDKTYPWVFYAIASYITGHVVYALSSILKGGIYNWIIKHFFKEDGWIRKKKVLKKKQASGLGLIEKANLIKKEKFPDDKLSSDINTYDWIKLKMGEKSPEVLSNVVRLESDSKFFRGLTVVCFLFFCVTMGEFVIAIAEGIKYASTSHLFEYSIIALILFLFSLWRHANRRFNAEELASLFIIDLYNEV